MSLKELISMTLPLSKGDRDPMGHPTVRTVQFHLSRKVRRIAQDGIFGEETDAATRSFQRKAGLEVDGIVGTKTWHHLSYNQGTLSMNVTPTGRTGRAIKELAHKIATGRFIDPHGHKIEYVFGAENNVFQPEKVRSTDCSELVQVTISTLTGKVWLDGSWNQYGGCTRIDVATAMRTPGALVFHTKNGRSSGIHHVGVAFGDGRRTIEARSAHTTPEVGVFDGRRRFNLAGTVPGFSYAAP
jgi:Putative peptidoglycan binding domain